MATSLLLACGCRHVLFVTNGLIHDSTGARVELLRVVLNEVAPLDLALEGIVGVGQYLIEHIYDLEAAVIDRDLEAGEPRREPILWSDPLHIRQLPPLEKVELPPQRLYHGQGCPSM